MKWWRRIRHRGQLDEELDKELRFHLEEHAADLIARGCDADEAHRRARLELGGLEQVKEYTRDARGTRWLEELCADTAYALRRLRLQPGFTALAVSTLALGIAVTTIMFTVVNGVLLAPLPFPQPQRLLTLQEKTAVATQFGDLWAFAYPNFRDVRSQSRTLTAAAWRFRSGLITGPGPAEQVDGREVSAEFLSVLDVSPVEGRNFRADEDRPGADAVVIISPRLWQRRFGGGDSAVGSKLLLDGRPHTVVGVAPDGLDWLGEPDILVLLGQSGDANLSDRAVHPRIRVVARLHEGATLADARADLQRIGAELAAAFPGSNEGRTFVADPLRPEVGEARPTLWLLLGAAGLVLLIGCVNVAGLLLARAMSRQREIGMRLALGAGRMRLVRQCLTESAVLGLCGCSLGVWLAAAGLRPFVAAWPGSLPRAANVALDFRVLLFAAGVSLAGALLFGLAPAVRLPAVGKPDLRLTTGHATSSASRLYNGFVVAQIALALLLLVSAGILGRTLLRLSLLETGIDTDHVLIARMALDPTTLEDANKTRATWAAILEDARRVAGVEAVALVDTVPMRPGSNLIAFSSEPTMPPVEEQSFALATSVTPDYERVMGLQLVRGRFFNASDRPDSEPVVVIDEVLARQAFGEREPVGASLWLPDLQAQPLRVIGVLQHVRHWGLAVDDTAPVRAQLYYPFAQLPDRFVHRWSELMSIALRTGGDPAAVLPSLRTELQKADGARALYETRTMTQLSAASIAQQRFLLLLFAAFAGLAMVLACFGVYGLLAYVTGLRAREMGVRLALGASPGGLIAMVLRQSVKLVAPGITIGLAGALLAARLLASLVPGVQPSASWTLVGMSALLGGAALLASFVPARRAARLDPTTTLRE